MGNSLITEDTLFVYSLLPKEESKLKMDLLYIHPYLNEFFTQKKELLTRQGVRIHQKGNRLIITRPSDLTIGVPRHLVLPRLQGESNSWTSETKDQAPRDLPRPDSEDPTRIWISVSESSFGNYSTEIDCLTEHNRASYMMSIMKAMYELLGEAGLRLCSEIETKFINFNNLNKEQ